ncbi:uncharacterized protein LOC120243574 [Hyaena hyaena]|uniref:uncharacterized protein LOC120243574 n=1 Tax=Hyaena hyaena TaxID=95912 RepID=UPI001923B8EC|nr:uncharacterized protein LOC120243574 [Hyaena hyaena]
MAVSVFLLHRDPERLVSGVGRGRGGPRGQSVPDVSCRASSDWLAMTSCCSSGWGQSRRGRLLHRQRGRSDDGDGWCRGRCGTQAVAKRIPRLFPEYFLLSLREDSFHSNVPCPGQEKTFFPACTNTFPWSSGLANHCLSKEPVSSRPPPLAAGTSPELPESLCAAELCYSDISHVTVDQKQGYIFWTLHKNGVIKYVLLTRSYKGKISLDVVMTTRLPDQAFTSEGYWSHC